MNATRSHTASVLLLFFATLFSFSARAQVDPFTGDFHYRVDLFPLPVQQYEPIPIQLFYSPPSQGSVASDIGLGWGINAYSMVGRSVRGVPDDWYRIRNYADFDNQDFTVTNGALYFDGTADGTTNDYGLHQFRMDGDRVVLPDLDQYYLVGIGQNGSMHPVYSEVLDIGKFSTQSNRQGMLEGGGFSLRPQFYLDNDYHARLKYPDDPVTTTSPNWNTGFQPEDFLGGDYYIKNNTQEPNNPQQENRLVTPNYVEYFTNQEILDHYEGGNGVITGFLDDPNMIDAGLAPDNISLRLATTSGLKLIGAYRVTTPDGYTFHYSLPVHVNSSISGAFPVDWPSGLAVYPDKNFLNVQTDEGSYLVTDVTPVSPLGVIESKTEAQYATQWLLTAVTGPDYEDRGTLGVVDEQDYGYWVKYDWVKWASEFESRLPLYGYATGRNTKRVESQFGSGTTMDENVTFGSFSSTEQEIYYLNKIETPSHTAVFVRDLRLDEHSAEDPRLYNEQVEELTEIDDNSLSFNMPFNGRGQTITTSQGVLYDMGGPDKNYTYTGESIITIRPDVSVTSFDIDFDEFYVASHLDDPMYGGAGSGMPYDQGYDAGNPELQGLVYVEVYSGETANPANRVAVNLYAGGTSGKLYGQRTLSNAASFSNINVSAINNAMTIRMVTWPYVGVEGRQRYTLPGFKMSWQANVSGSGSMPTLSGMSDSWRGMLQDENGPQQYGTQLGDYYYLIKPEGASQVQLSFDQFDFGNSSNDWLYVYDGEFTSTYTPPLVACIRGNKNAGTMYVNSSYGVPANALNFVNGTFTSTGNAVTIRADVNYSNPSGSGAGFRIGWEALWQDNAPPTVTPQLALKRILLFDNEGFAQVPVVTAGSEPFAATNSRFSYDATTHASTARFYNESWFTTNQTTIDANTLKRVDLQQDYSLQKGYWYNANTRIYGSNKTDNIVAVDARKNTVSGEHANSGKLTLTEVIVRDLTGDQAEPSYQFAYGDAAQNPDYTPHKADFWGFYKFDADNSPYPGFRTTASKDSVAMWCLREVTLPMGGKITVEYESDAFEHRLDNEDEAISQVPRVFVVKDLEPQNPGAATVGDSWRLTLDNDNASELQTLLSTLPAGAKVMVNLPWRETHFSTYPELLSYGSTDLAGFSISVSGGQALVSGLELYEHTDPPTLLPNGFPMPPVDNIELITFGYISIHYPSGTPRTQYGGGLRVKRMTTSNGNENYVTEYTYQNGVATQLMSPFQMPAYAASYPGYTFLESRDPNKLLMSPEVGYGTVQTRNLGLTGTAEGYREEQFLVDPTGIDYLAMQRSQTQVPSTTHPGSSYDDTLNLLTVDNDFAMAWGENYASAVYDKNSFPISRTKRDFTTLDYGYIPFLTVHSKVLQQSAGVPPVLYSYGSFNSFHYHQRRRKLMSIEQFDQSSYRKEVNVRFDSLTGMPLEVRTYTDPVHYNTVETTKAYEAYSVLGSKARLSTNANRVLANHTVRSTSWSDIANTSFDAYELTLFNRRFAQRSFDGTRYSATNQTYSVRPDRMVYWSGPLDGNGQFDGTQWVSYNVPSLPPADPAATPPPNPANSPLYKTAYRVTLMDPLGNVLEQVDEYGIYSASKYCFEKSMPMASLGNSNYESFTFCSFEDRIQEEDVNQDPVYFFEGEVSYPANNVNRQLSGNRDYAATTGVVPHGGNHYVSVRNGESAVYETRYLSTGTADKLQRGRTYVARVWMHESSPAQSGIRVSLDGADNGVPFNVTYEKFRNDASNLQIGRWVLVQVIFEVPEEYASTGGSAHNSLRIELFNAQSGLARFDDFQFSSVDLSFAARVYDEATGRLFSQLDDNGFAMHYIYDAAGRVKAVWREVEATGLKKVEERNYHFHRPFAP